MVVSDEFQDIFDASSKVSALRLPTLKQNLMKIEYGTHTDATLAYDGPEPNLPFASSSVFDASISGWRCLTAKDPVCKAVYEMTFDISGSDLDFKPGDTIGIIPRNKPSEVDFIISHLDLKSKADVPYTLILDKNVKGSKIPPHVPVKSTLKYVLTYCLEIRSVLKKLHILALSQHTKDQNERKVLEYLCSKEGSATYITHILNNNICILDLFAIFKSCKPPIEVLFANLPRLLPRPYSIVNSSLRDPNILKICFSVMDLDNNRKGLVTGWLEEMILSSSLETAMTNLTINTDERGQKVQIYLRKNLSGFHVPEDLGTPLIMVGPGTGVSPFIGFLEERETASLIDSELKMGEAWLFFGCRRPDLDFIYNKELTGFESKGLLNKIVTAYSRLESAECKYVQNAITKEGKEVTRLIENGASIFICGDLKTMASQIREAILNCLVESGKSPKEADTLMCDLQKEKRYFVDVWS